MPELCDLLGGPGLEGVEGDAYFDVVAVLGREWFIVVEGIMSGEPRSCE